MGECHLTLKGMVESMLEQAGIHTDAELRLEQLGYFEQPASKGHHLACEGGLSKHCVNVTLRLVELTKALGVKWIRAGSAPYVVGMLHDLVKCCCYRMKGRDANGHPEWEYVQPTYPGHGVCSVMIAAELGIHLYPDEIAAIAYHMGAFGIGKEYTEKEFDAAMKRFAPQIVATHSADWYAARVNEEESEVDG